MAMGERRGRVRAALAVAVVLAGALGVSVARPWQAQAGPTFQVEIAGDFADNDPGDGICRTGLADTQKKCSLRAALMEANKTSGATILVPAGIYRIARTGSGDDTGNNGDFDILTDMTIIGEGAALVIIETGPEVGPDIVDRVLSVVDNPLLVGTPTVTIRGVTLRSGQAHPADVGGGGFFSEGTVRLEDSVVEGNVAASGRGGGIYVAGGMLTLLRTTVRDNTAGEEGGGISVAAGATLRLEQATIAANTAPGGGGIASDGTLSIENTIVEDNTATGPGGGIESRGLVDIRGGIARRNTASGGGGLHHSGPATLWQTKFEQNVAGPGGGGGVLSEGTLDADYATFHANDTAGDGGGLRVSGSATLQRSLFLENHGARGGGLAHDGSTLTVTNVTFSANRAEARGGGIWSAGAGTVRHATLADNLVMAPAPGDGSAIWSGGGLSVQASIIAGACGGTPVSGGANVGTSATCGLTGAGDVVGDPLLMPLAANGGPTKTYALLALSPALSIVPVGVCAATDQRGIARPQGTGCDAGAFEAPGGPAPTPTPTPIPTPTPTPTPTPEQFRAFAPAVSRD